MAEQKLNLKDAATRAINGWLKEYLEQIYGVELNAGANEQDEAQKKLLAADDLAKRFKDRFKEIDLAPRDGLISYAEIDRAINFPLLHWTEKDLQMMKLLRRYYHILVELHDDEKERVDQGISRNDVDELVNALSELSLRVRSSMQKEYEGN